MNIQPLRDVILLEADGHNSQARHLDRWSIYMDRFGFPAMARELAASAITTRARAKMLNDVLAASEPKGGGVMIDRQGGKLVFECDCCDATFDGALGDEFTEAWNAAKSEGWKARKIGRDWIHACPDCEPDR